MAHQSGYQGIHLTGSLPLNNAEDVFNFIGSTLQPWVLRVPDGETGERTNWVLTQSKHFFDNPAFETVDATAEVGRKLVKIKAGVKPEDIRFEPFSYPDYASDSYPVFKKAKAEGRLAANSKFQISLPTPFNAVSFFVVLEDQAAVLPAYNAASKAALEDILRRFPHEELSIQWDLPTELVTVQGWFPNPLANEAAIYDTVAEVTSWVPEDVDVGYHLCYGDSKFGASPFMGKEGQCPFHHKDEGRHILPPDISTVVRVSNALTTAVGRPINFIQAATMRDWSKPEHWSALADLQISPVTQFYLGLVHASDGIDAARARRDIVSKFLPRFGISTECGLGRHSQAQLASVVQTFQALSHEADALLAAE